MKKAKCIKCGKTCVAGIDGIFNGNDVVECDKCAGVTRDRNNHAWQTEPRHIYIDTETGETTTVTREEAFGGTQ